MKKLIIMRGCPGSGKSWLAASLKDKYQNLGHSAVIFSTDDLFVKNGVYTFEPTKLGINHKRNIRHVFEAMQDDVNVVIVDNTNTTWDEVKKYCLHAISFSYEVEFAEPDTSWKYDIEELVKRNSHGVPRQSIQKMLDRYEDTASIKEKYIKLRGYV